MEKAMYKRILVATDGSELSDKAVQHALSLADMCAAELIAIRVVPHYPETYFEGGVALARQDIEAVEKQWEEEAQASVNAVRSEGQKRQVKVKALTVKAELVGEAVVAAAQQHKADLVVMASHGRKGIKRLLLGSETQHVLTHSHTPVLVLR
jgi:nucleotide-binding universal stress UspA family protein